MTDIKEAQGLEVIGYVAQDDINFKGDCTLRISPYSDYTIPVVRLSGATAVIDQLRKQLDEAKKLLDQSADECGPSMSRYINTWLETNK